MYDWSFLWTLLFFITTVIAVKGWHDERNRRTAAERLLAGIVGQLQSAEKFVQRKK